MTNDLRLKLYPAVIGVLSFLVVILLIEQYLPTQTEPIRETPIDRSDDSTQVDSAERVETSVPTPAVVEPSPTTSPAVPVPISPAAADLSTPGKLRVSNQTPYPIRVTALLSAAEGEAIDPASGMEQPYNEPVHWDFAPEEGSAKGLILSLPDRDLQLREGDVLVAFAQDGSRRYWGPYVVGETALPQRKGANAEWILILQP